MTAKRARGRPRAQAGHGDWDERAVAWERWEAVLMHSLAAVNPILFRALELAPGQRVLDVGCGTGDPALALAQWVGPSGRVVATDGAEAMLDVARRRAKILRLRNLTFRRMDMNRLRLRGRRFHRAVARYALMFADAPVAVLRSLRASLAPGGILVAAVWGPRRMSPGVVLREEAARPFLSGPPPDPERTPNPMRFERDGLLASHFRSAGFRNVRSEAVPVAATYPSVEDFARIQLESSLAELYEALGPAQRRRLETRLVARFRRFQSGPVVRVPAHSWVISGRR